MIEQPEIKTLILGVGNLLLSDEGVGVRVIERLTAEYELPEQVQVLDGGIQRGCILRRLFGAKTNCL